VSGREIFFIFPGQGSQYLGMGTDLVAEFPRVAELFEEASDVVGYDMPELCFRDPHQELDKTRYTQPALLTHEVACLEAFRTLAEGRLTPVLTAGHSLGEYAAMVMAGALSFADALKLVKRRGELMGELGRGGMVATTLDLQAAMALADKHYCGIGGCNLPEQTVIAGEDRDLDTLMADLEQNYPGKKGIRLRTEGAFHTYLMVHAAQQFRPVLEAAQFAPFEVDVLSNYTGKLHEQDPHGIRSRLFFQLFNPVRWVGCMNSAIDAGIDTIVELGGGIGKGEGPEGKRPNLESIVKKSLKWRQHEATYFAAINATTIRATVTQLLDKQS
jgi:[acyl-carrier-protein] S-malonyltransferase